MKLKEFLNDLSYRLYVSQKLCLCGELLNKQLSDRIMNKDMPLDHYNHAEGWEVEGFGEKQWLSIKCLKCRVSWSLDKLGIPRSTTQPLGNRTAHS